MTTTTWRTNAHDGPQTYQVEHTGEWPRVSYAGSDPRFVNTTLVDGGNHLFELFKIIRVDPRYKGLDSRMRELHERLVENPEFSNGEFNPDDVNDGESSMIGLDPDRVVTEEDKQTVALMDERHAAILSVLDQKISTVTERLRLYRQGAAATRALHLEWTNVRRQMPPDAPIIHAFKKCATELGHTLDDVTRGAEGSAARRANHQKVSV